MQFFFQLVSNGVAGQVASRLQRVTCPFCNLFCNFLELQRLHLVTLAVELNSTFCNDSISTDLLKSLQIDNYAKDGEPGAV